MQLIKRHKRKNIRFKENLSKANDRWNDWDLQLYLDNIEWVEFKNQDHKNNPF